MTREQMVQSIKRRIKAYSTPNEAGCWIWNRSQTYAGYGRLQVSTPEGRSTAWGAHRAAYVAWVGDVPDGLHLDHLCRVRNCVNPSHLEPVTVAENLARSPIAPATIHKAKTECIHGHAYTTGNTYTDKRGLRSCKTCRCEWIRAKRARLRGLAA